MQNITILNITAIIGTILCFAFYFLYFKNKELYFSVGDFAKLKNANNVDLTLLLKERRLIAIIAFFVMAFFIVVSCVIGYSVFVAIVLKVVDNKFLINTGTLIGGGTSSYLTYKVWRTATNDIDNLL
jgi:hypothetical protein